MAFVFVLDRSGVSQLLKEECVSMLEEMGQSIASAAGEGHEVESAVGRTRARVTVRTATVDAMVAEATTRNLTRAIDAGRR